MSQSLSRGLKVTIAISLTLLLLQCVLSYTIIGNFRAAVRENVDKQQFALVQAMGRETDEKIAGHLRLIAQVAKAVPPGALSDARAARDFLRRREEVTLTFDHGLFLFAASGKLVAGRDLNPAVARRVAIAYGPVVREVGARGKAAVSKPLPSPFDGEPVVMFCAPVFEPGGGVSGVVGGAFSLLHDNFLSNIAQVRIGQSGYLYLFGTDRTIIVHPDKNRILRRDVPRGVNRLFDRAIEGFDGSSETVNSRGIPSVSSCVHLKNVPWILAANFPFHEAYAPLRQARTNLFIAIAFTIAGSSFALLLIVRRMKREVLQRTRAEDHADLLLKSVGEGVVGVTPEGIINFANTAAAALLGYGSSNELLGRDVREILHHRREGCPTCPRENCPITPVFRAGEVQICENENLLRKDGSSLCADFSCTPVISGTTLRGAVVTFRDVTRRREAEEQLRLQVAALEAAANSILITDSESRIIWANDAFTRSTGYTKEEAAGRTPIELLSNGAGEEELFRDLMGTLMRQQAWHGELVTRRRDGTCYDEEVTITPVVNEQGETTNFIGIMQDVTERKEAGEELLRSKRALEESNRKLVQAMDRAGDLAERAERANAAKSRFLANMSHEIRTPLHAIIGMNHLLLDTPLTPRQGDYLRAVGKSAQSLLGIVNDILDFSKVEAGKLEIESVNFRPEEVVREVVVPFYAQAAEKSLLLRLELDRDLPTVLVGDPLRLSQILNNVLSNAVKFTRTGEIILQVRTLAKSGEEVELLFRVSDTGAGIAEKDQARLFQPFEQVDGSVTRTFGGTGLGLAICRQLTTLMGGTIWCESAPGKGSTFSFRLPFRAATPGAPWKRDGDEIMNLAGTRVLLVEDNEINQMVARELLKKVGVEVVLAENGQAAVTLVNEQEFDVILMDVQMPVMDGLTATRRIRALSRPDAATVPILAMTADAMEHDIQQCESAGMTGHVPKPFSPQKLYAAISRVVAERLPSNRLPFGEPAPQEGGPAAPGVLDVPKGTRQLGGNGKLYHDLLRRFLLEYRTGRERMEGLVSGGDRSGAVTMAHSVKGVAGVLAAEPLRLSAQALEGKLKGDHLDLQEEVASFLDELDRVLAAVCVELSDQEVPGREHGSEELRRGDLAGLEAALRACDPAACAAGMAALARRLWSAESGARVAQLGRLVDDYRYDEALFLLEELPVS